VYVDKKFVRVESVSDSEDINGAKVQDKLDKPLSGRRRCCQLVALSKKQHNVKHQQSTLNEAFQTQKH
jgi:hypothetical protein